MTNPNRSLPVMGAILAATVLAGGASGASSSGDPRKCDTTPPGAHHAYTCAKAAATTVTRTTMAKRQGVARWYPVTTCEMNSSLLRWKCYTLLGGDHWTVTVTFRALSSGWKQTVTVTKTL